MRGRFCTTGGDVSGAASGNLVAPYADCVQAVVSMVISTLLSAVVRMRGEIPVRKRGRSCGFRQRITFRRMSEVVGFVRVQNTWSGHGVARRFEGGSLHTLETLARFFTLAK